MFLITPKPPPKKTFSTKVVFPFAHNDYTCSIDAFGTLSHVLGSLLLKAINGANVFTLYIESSSVGNIAVLLHIAVTLLGMILVVAETKLVTDLFSSKFSRHGHDDFLVDL